MAKEIYPEMELYNNILYTYILGSFYSLDTKIIILS